MQKEKLLYEGKAKKVYRTEKPEIYLVEYKDDATAFNGAKKGTIAGKGVVNNQLSAHFFSLLEKKGISTHFVELLSEREMAVKALKIFKVEVVVRNIVAGSLAKRLGLDEGLQLPRPVLEFYYKEDELNDPMINEYHIYALELATPEQIGYISKTALKVNDILVEYLKNNGIVLVDFKLEFGTHGDKILLGDEISPDTCRFWDAESSEKLDKDRFRRDLGGVEDAYQEVYRRLLGG